MSIFSWFNRLIFPSSSFIFDESLFVMRLGGVGTGKTLSQTEDDVLSALLSDVDVYCCYWLNWNLPNYHYFSPTKQAFLADVVDKQNCVVVFDEIGQVFRARDWEDEESIISKWFQLHRHNMVSIIANTQDLSLVAKSAGIIVNDWRLVDSLPDSSIVSWFLSLFKISRIGVRTDFVSLFDLKRIASGFDIGVRVDDVPFSWSTKHYNIKKILHPELDEYKIELVHKFCPVCRRRSGSQILKEDTLNVCDFDPKRGYSLKVPEYCPKHKHQLLEVHLSGIYDTYFIPDTPPLPDLVWVAYQPSPKGYTMLKVKGLPPVFSKPTFN